MEWQQIASKKRDEIIAQKANEINIDFLAFNNRGHDLVNYIKKGKRRKNRNLQVLHMKK